jgi:ribosomal protein S24E
VFHGYSDVERDEIAGKISVMGRSSLNAKLLLVQALKTCFGGQKYQFLGPDSGWFL